MAGTNNRRNKTQDLFLNINYYTSVAGLLNVWGGDARVPAVSKNICYKVFYYLMNLGACWQLVMQVVALYTQKDLNSKQQSDLIVLALCHPAMYSAYQSMQYYRKNLKELLFCLAVLLKNVYNDEEVEEKIIKKAKTFMSAYFSFCLLSLISYGGGSLLAVVRSGKPFITAITAWPDIHDTSTAAHIVRVFNYVFWWVIMTRGSAAYLLAISTVICLNHQFKNVQSYFYRLERIFKEDFSQQEKEEKYIAALKVGIQLHSDTLWCAREMQTVFSVMYSAQIYITLGSLAVLLLQMFSSERTVFNVLAVLSTAAAVLITTGIFMWNAGDVTIEASLVSTAVYFSGWQHVEMGASVRVRRLINVAMAQTQVPVIIRAFGIFEMSYQTYVSIVKSSYSVFSFIY